MAETQKLIGVSLEGSMGVMQFNAPEKLARHLNEFPDDWMSSLDDFAVTILGLKRSRDQDGETIWTRNDREFCRIDRRDQQYVVRITDRKRKPRLIPGDGRPGDGEAAVLELVSFANFEDPVLDRRVLNKTEGT